MRKQERASHDHYESFQKAIQSHHLSVKAIPVVGLPILEALERRASASSNQYATYQSHLNEPCLGMGTISSRNQHPDHLDTDGTLRGMTQQLDAPEQPKPVRDNSTQQIKKLKN